MTVAVGFLICSLLAAGAAAVAWGLASSHPAPSQTALIPTFLFLGGAAVIFFILTIVAFLIGLFT